jgi:hypothetical protein
MPDLRLLLNNRPRQFRAFEGLAVFGPKKLARLVDRHNEKLPLSRQCQVANRDPIVLIRGPEEARRKSRENSDTLAFAKRELKVRPRSRIQGLEHGRGAGRMLAQNEDVNFVGSNQGRNRAGERLSVSIPIEEIGHLRLGAVAPSGGSNITTRAGFG